MQQRPPLLEKGAGRGHVTLEVALPPLDLALRVLPHGIGSEWRGASPARGTLPYGIGSEWTGAPPVRGSPPHGIGSESTGLFSQHRFDAELQILPLKVVRRIVLQLLLWRCKSERDTIPVLGFTRYCHHQYHMVYGIKRSSRWGGVYCAMVV